MKSFILPLKVMQVAAAMFLTLGALLGFPDDVHLSAVYWGVTAVMLVLGVIEYGIQNGRS